MRSSDGSHAESAKSQWIKRFVLVLEMEEIK